MGTLLGTLLGPLYQLATSKASNRSFFSQRIKKNTSACLAVRQKPNDMRFSFDHRNIKMLKVLNSSYITIKSVSSFTIWSFKLTILFKNWKFSYQESPSTRLFTSTIYGAKNQCLGNPFWLISNTPNLPSNDNTYETINYRVRCYVKKFHNFIFRGNIQ